MSEAPAKTDSESRYHITRWIFPAGHLHPAAGVLKFEQVRFFSGVEASSKLAKTVAPFFIEMVGAKDDKDQVKELRGKIVDAVLNHLREYAKFQHDYNVSIGGRGRKEGTGINIHMNAGISMPEAKGSLMERLHLKKKEESIAVRPSETK